MISSLKKYYPELLGSLICLMLGTFSGYSVKASDTLWYSLLHKPIVNPPAWVFGPAWTILYLMIGIVFAQLWTKQKIAKIGQVLFILQFLLNLLWSPLFFYYQRIDWALFDLTLLWACLIYFMVQIRHKPYLVLWCLPYTLWVTFALILNAAIYYLNMVVVGG